LGGADSKPADKYLITWIAQVPNLRAEGKFFSFSKHLDKDTIRDKVAASEARPLST
jgi:hypothetical protein